MKAKIVDPINQLVPYPLVLRPDVRANYFQEVSNPLATIYGLLTSPMIMITGAMLVLVFVMNMMGGTEMMQEMQQELAGSRQGPEKSPLDNMAQLVPRPRQVASNSN